MWTTAKSGNTNTKQNRIQGKNIKWDKDEYLIMVNKEIHEEVIQTMNLHTLKITVTNSHNHNGNS